MREIVLDTETTGLDPANGDRIVDIGCVELINHVPTGKVYQQYINPQRAISQEVINVHGLTEEFLSDKPTFEEIADDFLDFVGDSTLVIHNAAFDLKFLNAELSWAEKPTLSQCSVVDTLLMARKKFPGSRVNLDELCKRFGIDNSSRSIHGALLDSQLLAEVYLELLGGKEPDFLTKKKENSDNSLNLQEKKEKQFRPARSFPVSNVETEAHQAFIQTIKDNLWEEA